MIKSKVIVCAIVVTFNRKKLLKNCLDSLINQSYPLTAIYILDNASNDKTEQLLFDSKYIDVLPPTRLSVAWETKKKMIINGSEIVIHYVRMHKNTGGAGGFYEGVKRAYKKGYEWIWLMDDDVEPDNQCLEKLLENSETKKVLVPLRCKFGEILCTNELPAIKYDLKSIFKVGTKCRTPISSKYRYLDELPLTMEVEDMAFEGPIIHRKVIEKVGFPMKEFFIYGDDTEYSFRIRKMGEKIYLVKEAKIYRKIDAQPTHKISWKDYYIFRNYLWLYRNYGEGFGVRTIRPLYFFVRRIFGRIVRLDIKGIKYYLYSFLDSINLSKNRFKP